MVIFWAPLILFWEFPQCFFPFPQSLLFPQSFIFAFPQSYFSRLRFLSPFARSLNFLYFYFCVSLVLFEFPFCVPLVYQFCQSWVLVFYSPCSKKKAKLRTTICVKSSHQQIYFIVNIFCCMHFVHYRVTGKQKSSVILILKTDTITTFFILFVL